MKKIDIFTELFQYLGLWPNLVLVANDGRQSFFIPFFRVAGTLKKDHGRCKMAGSDWSSMLFFPSDASVINSSVKRLVWSACVGKLLLFGGLLGCYFLYWAGCRVEAFA